MLSFSPATLVLLVAGVELNRFAVNALPFSCACPRFEVARFAFVRRRTSRRLFPMAVQSRLPALAGLSEDRPRAAEKA